MPNNQAHAVAWPNAVNLSLLNMLLGTWGPAEAGIQFFELFWTPAFAGVTMWAPNFP